MYAREEREIILVMNPAELRRLADKMDKVWGNLKCGDSCFVDILSYKDPKVILHLDQEYFHDRERERVNKRSAVKSWTSVAEWSPLLNISENKTEDTHYNREEAESVCRLLEKEGYGGEGVHFPLKTYVKKLDL